MGKSRFHFSFFGLLIVVIGFQNCTNSFISSAESASRNDAVSFARDNAIAGELLNSVTTIRAAGLGPQTSQPVQASVLNRNIPSINLQDYFPRNARITTDFRIFNGFKSVTYSFYPGNSDFYTVYNYYQNIQKPGSLLIWQKNGYSAGAPEGGCLATYGMLWLGSSDKSITEVGDWYPTNKCGGGFGAFSYRERYNANVNTGIVWSDVDGLTPTGTYRSYQTAFNGQTMGTWAYNWTGLMGVYDTYTMPYGLDSSGKFVSGAGKTYKNVAMIYFLHGIAGPGIKENFCTPDSSWQGAGLYRHVAGYSSYASLYLLAPGEGIIQEFFLFNETDNYFGPDLTCRGYALGKSANASTSDGSFLNPLVYITYGTPKVQ